MTNQRRNRYKKIVNEIIRNSYKNKDIKLNNFITNKCILNLLKKKKGKSTGIDIMPYNLINEMHKTNPEIYK